MAMKVPATNTDMISDEYHSDSASLSHSRAFKINSITTKGTKYFITQKTDYTLLQPTRHSRWIVAIPQAKNNFNFCSGFLNFLRGQVFWSCWGNAPKFVTIADRVANEPSTNPSGGTWCHTFYLLPQAATYNLQLSFAILDGKAMGRWKTNEGISIKVIIISINFKSKDPSNLMTYKASPCFGTYHQSGPCHHSSEHGNWKTSDVNCKSQFKRIQQLSIFVTCKLDLCKGIQNYTCIFNYIQLMFLIICPHQ